MSDSPALHNIGTLYFKHGALGYGLLIPGAFLWIWSVLQYGSVTDGIDKPYVDMVIASIWLFFGLVGLGLHYLARSNSPKGNEEISAIIDDKAFIVGLCILGTTLLVCTLTVYFTDFNLPPTTNISLSYHLDNITLYLQVGARRQILKKTGAVLGIVLSLISVIIFFMPWTHGSLLGAKGIDESNIENRHFDATQKQPLAKWSQSKGARV